MYEFLRLLHRRGREVRPDASIRIPPRLYNLELKLEPLTTLEWPSASSTLLEELERHASTTMIREWIMLLTTRRIIRIIAIIVSLA
jgi:hypothetical protein